jgi:ankyrin repeat protein
MSCFGNKAHFATPHEFQPEPPEQMLRSNSLLHIAVARSDQAGVLKQLELGVPVDLLAQDGLAPLHWSLATEGTAMPAFLLQVGSPVDVRSVEGATPLMNAVQNGGVEQVSFFLQRGADVNARDHRGFTALHRAAEMGKHEIVRILLHEGADASPEAEGHTPRSLAESRGEREIVNLLDRGA